MEIFLRLRAKNAKNLLRRWFNTAYRNIYISSPVKLSTRNEQLVVNSDNQSSIPIEDINSIVIEDLSTSITCHALHKCTENNVAVYLCNNKHLPSAIVLPLNQYHRQLKILQNQINISKPTKKRLWQQIIKQKIKNQGECLKILEKENFHKLLELSKLVNSGDTENIESTAAIYYFKSLFGNKFIRSEENIINSALNYGYAIIRGHIARSLIAHGFEPCLGIFHCNQLNNFNLADDLIEPFRPMVDLYVAQNILNSNDAVFERKHKLGLYNLVSYSIFSGSEKHSLTYAIERLVKSLFGCYLGLNEQILLPELIPLRIHEYE